MNNISGARKNRIKKHSSSERNKTCCCCCGPTASHPQAFARFLICNDGLFFAESRRLVTLRSSSRSGTAGRRQNPSKFVENPARMVAQFISAASNIRCALVKLAYRKQFLFFARECTQFLRYFFHSWYTEQTCSKPPVRTNNNFFFS